MEFSDLQHSWQQQAAPPAAPAAPVDTPATLLAETQRMHRFSQRRNKLTTKLLLFALGLFFISQLIHSHNEPLTPARYAGLALLSVNILGFLGLTWRGTTLRQAVQPGLDSRAYVRASLRAFRFRRTALLWLALPYAVLLSVGLLLLSWLHLQVTGWADWWKVALWMGVFLGMVLVGRFVGLRKYEREFGSIVRKLEHWAAAWAEEATPTASSH